MLTNKERILLQESAEKNILKYVMNISLLLNNVLHSHDLRIYGFEWCHTVNQNSDHPIPMTMSTFFSEDELVRICFQNKKGNVGRYNVGWYKCVRTRNVAGRWKLNIRETLTCLVSPKITPERVYWRGGFKFYSGRVINTTTGAQLWVTQQTSCTFTYTSGY